MNDLKIFFNTKVVDSHPLSAIGDFGLTPVRYFFGGKTVEFSVVTKCNKHLAELDSLRTYHIPSFTEQGSETVCSGDLESTEKSWLKTAAAVLLLIPGLLLAIAKLASYIFADTRENHQLVKNVWPLSPLLLRKQAAAKVQSPAPVAMEKNYQLEKYASHNEVCFGSKAVPISSVDELQGMAEELTATLEKGRRTKLYIHCTDVSKFKVLPNKIKDLNPLSIHLQDSMQVVRRHPDTCFA